MNILYTIVIFPIEQIMELAYYVIYRVFVNYPFKHVLSVLGISLAVSFLTLPLYLVAEKYQRSEKIIQKRMKPEVDNIKAVFSGDERFMRLATYYRQNGYHPVYSLRSSISIAIQIPFFIAAYHFLSNLEALNGVSFGFIRDMSQPDSLLKINNLSINILPIIMTIINCASAGIYTKGFTIKDKVQLYGMALVFMILLYNSSSGMVLYWTGNNIFSLIKNIFQKTKIPKSVTVVLAVIFCLIIDIYLVFIRKGQMSKQYLLAFIISFIPVLLFLYQRKNAVTNNEKIQDNYRYNIIFILSLVVLFLLAGLVIPSSLIASSVQEFSFIENYKSPFPFIANTVLQSFGIFILWPVCIYCMLSQNTRKILAKSTAILPFIVIVNVFIFPGKYGYMTLMLNFSERLDSNQKELFLNLLTIIIIALFVFIFIYRFKMMMSAVLIVVICSLLIMGTVNTIKINRDFYLFQLQQKGSNNLLSTPIYRFSKTGRNVLVIMLDRALSAFIPYIFDEKNELNNSFDGFTWYKNTISFGQSTNYGVPGIFGGYEYTPLEMQARNNIPVVDKHNEALLMLPKIFLDHGYKVTVTDPPYANYSLTPDLSIFNRYPEISADNVIGKYNWMWLSNKPDIFTINTAEILKNYLIRFSFFKFVPLLFRNVVYDNSDWLTLRSIKMFGKIEIPQETLKNYTALDVLPDITIIDETEINTYNVLTNNITHEPSLLQVPEYVPGNKQANTGNGPFADSDNYHVTIAALLLLGKWFDYLKDKEVYDNTRIIIVSDHGSYIYRIFPDSFVLPNGDYLEKYCALLMVKDFDSHGNLLVNDLFMTNADVPLIALNNIVKEPVNPWTGKEITSDKKNGVTLTTSKLWGVNSHPKYVFNIKPDEWLHVHTNIYDPENWSKVIP
jgi:YidC/Oxa1 family membrane protein insertase